VSRKTDAATTWPLAGLIVLSTVPVVVGVVRISQLTMGAEVTPDNARFFAAPWSVVLHIVSSAVFSVLGAFQFSADFRRQRPGWHRQAGRVLVLCGLLSAVSGVWMTLTYPRYEGGDLLYAFRLFFGSAMVASLVLGFAAIRRRDVLQHRAWITRGYAIGLGAGTQFVVHVPWLLIFGRPDELSKALLMGAGWVINLVVAERSFRAQRRPVPRTPNHVVRKWT
jgi:uncharacterized membrane protein